jgi:hypothetical protein
MLRPPFPRTRYYGAKVSSFGRDELDELVCALDSRRVEPGLLVSFEEGRLFAASTLTSPPARGHVR